MSGLIQVCGVLVQWLSVHCALHSTVCLGRVGSLKVVDTRYGHISYCKIMVTFRKVCIRSHNIHVMAQTCTFGPQWVRDRSGQCYALSAGCNQTWWSSQVTCGNNPVQGSDRNTTTNSNYLWPFSRLGLATHQQ